MDAITLGLGRTLWDTEVEIHIRLPNEKEPSPLIGIVINPRIRIRQIEDAMLEASKHVVRRLIEKDMFTYRPIESE